VKNIFTVTYLITEKERKNIGHLLYISVSREKRKQAVAIPRNDASFAIFMFALQIPKHGKHAVAFVLYR